MKLNFRNLARKASLGLETDAGAAKRGYGKADLIKAREFIAKFGGKIRYKTKFKKNHVLEIEHDYSEINENQIEEAKKEFEQILDREFELRKADLKKAFELMTENIWGWWD